MGKKSGPKNYYGLDIRIEEERLSALDIRIADKIYGHTITPSGKVYTRLLGGHGDILEEENNPPPYSTDITLAMRVRGEIDKKYQSMTFYVVWGKLGG